MAGLIEEIQRDAVNSSIPLDSLLRRLQLAVAKLKLEVVEAWVEHELNGYRGVAVPEYRTVRGDPVAWNPFNGWIPIYDERVDVMSVLSEVRIPDSVTSLADLVAKDDNSRIHYPMHPELISLLNKGNDFTSPKMHVIVSRGVILSILNKVRNLVLTWAIEMEKKGVLGEGVTFNPAEQARAATANITIGTIGTLNGVIGSGNQTGDIIFSGNQIKAICEASDKIRANISQLVAAGADEGALREALDNIDAEASKPQPQTSRLKGFLGDARNAISGAAGSLIAEGALGLIASVVG